VGVIVCDPDVALATADITGTPEKVVAPENVTELACVSVTPD